MRILIAIDDTDNLESRGTGHRARQLAAELEANGLADIDGITRHQLLVDPRIPYTSHNSSACLTAEADPARRADLIAYCRDFLLRESASGSDAGLCVARWDQANSEIRTWGMRAKTEVLHLNDAVTLAAQTNVYLEGLTGTHGGMIGALAAVGLRAAENDGRFLWLHGMRELMGVYTVAQLRAAVKIDSIETESGERAPAEARVDVGERVRLVMRAGKAVLFVEKVDHVECDWRVAPKDRIKQLSN